MKIFPSPLSSRSGQTLVEALMAISLLTMGLIGIVTLLSQSYNLDRTNSDDIQATYLSAEGIELAKNFIDHDVYQGIASGGDGKTDWATCFGGIPPGGTRDYILGYGDVTCPTPVTAAQAQGDLLVLNTSTDGRYYYSSSPVKHTVFSRDIRITMPAATYPYEIDVQSIVKWNTGFGTSDQLILEDHFYDWHP